MPEAPSITMTSNFMHNQVRLSSTTNLTSTADFEDVDLSPTIDEAVIITQATEVPPESFQRYTDPRVQAIKLSASVRTARGVPGLTPPYLPAAPSLLRAPSDDTTSDNSFVQPSRAPSPLRTLALINVPSSPATMPHAVSIPHSGFQALILCGPGIGLSTFTSIPAEYPKALIEIANRPMIWYVLDWCYRMGVTDISIIAPPTSKDVMQAALGQNPYLTSLPSPTPDLITPKDLDYTTPTAVLLRLPEVQDVIKSDFLLLPCDLICGVPGDALLESYLTRLGEPGGVGVRAASDYGSEGSRKYGLDRELSSRRGGLSIWYNTANREESVKGEECDFMCTTQLDSKNDVPFPLFSKSQDFASSQVKKLVTAMPMSELKDQCEEDKERWRIRRSLLRHYGSVKCLTTYRDSHIYIFPEWVKEYAALNEDFESVSEDLVGTWAKCQWRKPSYRAERGVGKIFGKQPEQVEEDDKSPNERNMEEQIDFLSLSSTQHSRPRTSPPSSRTPQTRLASRVGGKEEDRTIAVDDSQDFGFDVTSAPEVPPILSYILPSTPIAPLVRRVDTTPLLLSVSLVIAKIAAFNEPGQLTSSSLAHPAKIAPTAAIAQKVSISRSDTLIDSNTSIATKCVIKTSVIGSSVSIGTGSKITNCVIMSGATIGDDCILTGTIVGKKANIGHKSKLTNCEVQDANILAEETEGKGEKYLIGGLEDEHEDEDGLDYVDGDGEEIGFGGE